MGFVIFIIVAVGIAFIAWLMDASKKAEEERKKRVKEMLAQEERKKLERQTLLDEREREFGILTKEIRIDRDKYIHVYEGGKTIFILEQAYKFEDILTCSIEKVLVKKGTTTQITTPDRREMAEQQVLWGMGQKYNVKSTTQIRTTPDEYKYVVYIGVNSISNPQISLTTKSHYIANEICSLINVIISTRQ